MSEDTPPNTLADVIEHTRATWRKGGMSDDEAAVVFHAIAAYLTDPRRLAALRVAAEAERNELPAKLDAVLAIHKPVYEPSRGSFPARYECGTCHAESPCETARAAGAKP